MRLLLVAGALSLWCAALAGCTGLFHSTQHPDQVYYLRTGSAGEAGAMPATAPDAAPAPAPGEAAAGAAPARAASLRVARPLASPGLDSYHIALLQSDHRMNVFAASRWPGPVPEVLESLAVQALRASGAWSAVEDSTAPFPTDFLLQLTVRRFDADYTDGAATPTVRVTLDCIVGRGEGGDVVATFTASGSAPAAANRMTAVVAAFEQATRAALAELTQRAAQAARTDQEHAAG